MPWNDGASPDFAVQLARGSRSAHLCTVQCSKQMHHLRLCCSFYTWRQSVLLENKTSIVSSRSFKVFPRAQSSIYVYSFTLKALHCWGILTSHTERFLTCEATCPSTTNFCFLCWVSCLLSTLIACCRWYAKFLVIECMSERWYFTSACKTLVSPCTQQLLYVISMGCCHWFPWIALWHEKISLACPSLRITPDSALYLGYVGTDVNCVVSKKWKYHCIPHLCHCMCKMHGRRPLQVLSNVLPKPSGLRLASRDCMSWQPAGWSTSHAKTSQEW